MNLKAHVRVPHFLIFDDSCSFCRFLSELGRSRVSAEQVIFFPSSKARLVFSGLLFAEKKLIFLKITQDDTGVFYDDEAWENIQSFFSELTSLSWLVKKILTQKSSPKIFTKIRSFCLHCRRKFA